MLKCPHSYWRRLTALAVVAVTSGATAPDLARADETPTSDLAAARSLFEEAVGHAQGGRWTEARDRYRRSLELHDDPVTRYSLAVTNLELGHLVAARDGFARYLRETDDDDEPGDLREAARRAIAAIEPRIPTLDVAVTPPNAEVLVDGELVDDRRVRLDPGDHWVEVTAEGYARVTKDVALNDGDHRRVAVTLERIAPSSSPHEHDEAYAFPTGPVVLMAAGGAVGVTGLGIGLGAVAHASGKREDAPEMTAIRRQAIAGDVLTVLGATTAVAGLSWWLAMEGGDGEGDRPSVAVALAPSGAALRLGF